MSPSLISQVLLSQFRVDSFLASGGMGAVYRVWDLKRNVPLAMKVLHTELADDPSMFKRFKREANALKKLAHPNIVPFYGLYQTMDFAFLLERYIDGPSLKEIMYPKKVETLSIGEALVYMKALCAALGYAHVNGVVHCDVKPGNVMVDHGGNIYLTDFGVARHSESMTTTLGSAGTPAYMAPEQITGGSVTPAADIYALGVLLFEMLTGQRPFRGTESGTDKSGATANERIRFAHLHLPPPDPRSINPNIPDAIAKVILKTLNKDIGERYRSTADFFAALCVAAGLSPETIASQVILPNTLTTKDYSSGQEVIAPHTTVGGIGNLLQGLPVKGILFIGGFIVVGAIISIALKSGSGADKPLPTQMPLPTYTPYPTPIPTNTFSPITKVPAAVIPPTPRPTSVSTRKLKISISLKDTSSGDFLEVTGGTENYNYRIGPLASGAYALGPNNKFLVYVANDGWVYVARMGDTNLHRVVTLKDKLEAILKSDTPRFDLSFTQAEAFTLIIYERVFAQTETVVLPRAWTN